MSTRDYAADRPLAVGEGSLASEPFLFGKGPKPVNTGRFYAELGTKAADFMNIRPFVIIESPFMGATPELLQRNIAFLRACLRDSILRGEAPFASHGLYTQPDVLRDEVPEEREIGMNLGWHVMRRASQVAIYTDLGWSSGMKRGRDAALSAGKKIEERTLAPAGIWEENYIATPPSYYGF